MSDTKQFSLTPSLAIIIAGLVIAGSILYVNRAPAPSAIADSMLPASTNVAAPSESDHVFGNPKAPIVLIEYSDFECYYCAQAYPTFKRLVEESDGKVAWVMRNFPLESIHPQARGAAMAAECIAELAGNEAYWRYAEAVFTNQAELSPLYSRSLALQFGVGHASYDQCIAEDRYAGRIDAETGAAITAGGQGTPFTVVWSDGYQAPISGALPYEQFRSVIQAVEARL